MAITSLADLYRSERPEMLRAPVVADLLGIRIQMVYQLTRSGELPHVRLARSVRYPSHKLLEYIENGGNPAYQGEE